MQLLALSDVIWGAIITLIGSTVTTLSVLLVVWMQLRTKVALVKLGVDQAKAATDVADTLALSGKATAEAAAAVKTTLETSGKAAEAAAGEVRDALAEHTEDETKKFDHLIKTVDILHTMGNSQQERLLKLNAETSRAKAQLTQDPEERRVAMLAAELAERELKEHQDAQRRVDEKK